MTTTAPQDEPRDETTDAPAPRARSTPAPRRQAESGADQIAAAVEGVGEGLARSKNPLVSLIVTVIATGGIVGAGGYGATNAISAQVAEMGKKLDKLGDDLTATRGALDAMKSDNASAVARAQAERHEERIRTLEDSDRAKERALDKIHLEIEALKKGGK